jgi:hypothetical protein
MLYREIIAVYSQIYTKHINIHSVGGTWNCWMLNLMVNIDTKMCYVSYWTDISADWANSEVLNAL